VHPSILTRRNFQDFDGINYALAGQKKMDELITLIAHAFRLTLKHDRLFIDCSNAFNQVDGAEAAKAVITKCPSLANYYYFLYQEDTIFGFKSLTTYTNVKSPLDIKENSILSAFLDDSAISAAHKVTVDAFDSYKRDGPQNGLNIDYDENRTVVLLGNCEDDAESQRHIATYFDRGIPLTNIKVHQDNGGPKEDDSYIYLGAPVGSKI
jgi:hypothetical protein